MRLWSNNNKPCITWNLFICKEGYVAISFESWSHHRDRQRISKQVWINLPYMPLGYWLYWDAEPGFIDGYELPLETLIYVLLTCLEMKNINHIDLNSVIGGKHVTQKVGHHVLIPELTKNWELSWCHLCHHWWHHMLSQWQPLVPLLMTNLVSWKPFIFHCSCL